MNLDIVITGCIGLITTIAGSFSGWFFARKKYNTEVDHNLIENLQASLDFYKTLVDDNTKRLNEVLARNNELADNLHLLLKKNEDLEKELSTVRNQMFEMMSNICYDLTCTLRKDMKEKNILKNSKNIKSTKHIDKTKL